MGGKGFDPMRAVGTVAAALASCLIVLLLVWACLAVAGQIQAAMGAM